MRAARSRAITILDAGLMRFKHEAAAIGIHKRVTLPALDLLSAS